MRDKDGRALVNAHVLGFLRRICKLLFYGIKPVFMFDGGAPTLKRMTIVRIYLRLSFVLSLALTLAFVHGSPRESKRKLALLPVISNWQRNYWQHR